MPIKAMRYALISAIVICTGVSHAGAQSAALYVSQPQQVVRLVDRNGDGDFLDYAEVQVYALGLPSNLGAIAGDGQRLFVIDVAGARVLILRDLNGDGDALDYAEVAIYGELPPGGPPPTAAGLALDVDGSLLTADSAAGLLYRLSDVNSDGDALDLDECTVVAAGLTAPSAVSIRPDDRLLVAQNLAAVPVRILLDHNGDGDFLDFAENISYAEAIAPGQDLVATTSDSACLTRPNEGTIVRLYDWTGDGDALDFGEVLLHAQGLDKPFAIAAAPDGSLFVAARNTAGAVYHVADRNGDGDALDYGETLVVAVGISQPGGVVFVTDDGGCRKGDIDGNGEVNLSDVPLLVDVLLGLETLDDYCPADCNADGRIDAADIQPFIEAFL